MKYIITADQHYRPDLPLCRHDVNWMETQRNNLEFIVNLANQNGADIIMAGDTFDVPRVPPSITNMFLDEIIKLKGTCYMLAGNHCLPWHKLENLKDSSMGIIASISMPATHLQYLDTMETSENGRFEHVAFLNDEIAVVHTLTFENEIPYGANGTTAQELLNKYPHKYIITGDNHTGFIYKNNGRMVINPGCTLIQTADMIDYTPRVVLFDDGEISWINLPNDKTTISDQHIQEKKERDARISAFVETVRNNGKISLSFLDNLKKAMNNLTDQDIIDILLELMEEANGR